MINNEDILIEKYLDRKYISYSIAELFFSINDKNKLDELLKEKKEHESFYRRLTGFLRGSIFLYDISAHEFDIISNYKIFLSSDINFCLLFEKNDTYDEKFQYSLVQSTLGVEYNLNNTLFEQLNSFTDDLEFKGVEKIIEVTIETEQEKTRLYTKNNSIRGFAPLFNDDNTIKILKSYRFNSFAAISLNENQYVLILGLDIPIPSNAKIYIYGGTYIEKNKNYFYSKLKFYSIAINKKIRENIIKYNISFERSKSRKEDSYKTYLQLISVYKNILREDEIDNVHLFLFNVYDRRLYYTFVETMKIDKQTFCNYEKICNENKEQSLALTKNQFLFVENRLKALSKKMEPNLVSYNKLLEILENIHNTKWMKQKLFPNGLEKPLDNNIVWHTLLVLSCIPQEPWTGVAGFSAHTKVFDISSSGEYTIDNIEERWQPEKLDKAHFYCKLMVYENIAGIGGQGSMASFPILDSGQLAGTIFITKKQVQSNSGHIRFRKETLRDLLTLSSIFRSFIWQKRNSEFVDSVIRDLLSEPKEIINPFKVIGDHLPKLLNPLLVVLWESNDDNLIPSKPKYIWGYKRNLDDIDEEKELIPLQYQIIHFSDSDLKWFTNKNFHFIQNAKYSKNKTGKFNLKLISSDKVEGSMPNSFIKAYEKISSEGSMSEQLFHSFSLAEKLRNGSYLVFSIFLFGREYFLITYFEEKAETISNNFNNFIQKFEKIYSVIFTDELLIKMANAKLASSHELDTAFVTPLKDRIDEIDLLLKDKEIDDDKRLKRIGHIISYCSENLIYNLKNAVARIDNTTLKSSYIPENIFLIPTIHKIWEDLRFNWSSKGSEYYSYLYDNTKLLVSNSENYFDIQSEESDDLIKMREIAIKFKTDQFKAIIYNLLNNTFKASILPWDDHLQSKASIFIEIIEYSERIELKYKNQGKKLSLQECNWMNKLAIDKYTLESDFKIISPSLLESYKDLFAKENETNKKKQTGFGIFNINKYLWENGKQLKFSPLFNVESNKRFTIFTLTFPKGD